jgi:DNA-binding XRE family transcriptional regulator
MSRRKKSRTDGGFVMVSRQMTRSAAFRSLSPRAGWLLVGLMDRYGGNDNRVPMSMREAATWLKTGLHQAADAFSELESRGFVRCHERGGFTRKVRHATVWTLTMFGRGGQKATLDFLEWQPADSKTKFETRLPRRQQYGCRLGNNRPLIDAGTASVGASHGCQDGINTGAGAATLLEYTINDGAAVEWRPPTYIELPAPKKRAPRNSGIAWPAAERKRLGLSQPEFARRAGIRREYLSTIEQGRRPPSADIRARIEAALRMTTH